MACAPRKYLYREMKQSPRYKDLRALLDWELNDQAQEVLDRFFKEWISVNQCKEFIDRIMEIMKTQGWTKNELPDEAITEDKCGITIYDTLGSMKEYLDNLPKLTDKDIKDILNIEGKKHNVSVQPI
jgi:hypothetical protein